MPDYSSKTAVFRAFASNLCRFREKPMRRPLLMLFLGSLFSMACQEIPPRTLVYNGTIYPATKSDSTVESMVLEGSYIVFSGPLEDAATLLNPSTADTIDLAGQTVIPGFIESHGHFMGMGFSAFTLPLAKASSFEVLIQMVADSVAARPEGSWIVGRGWHQDKWSDTPELVDGQPVHTLISEVSPNNPVVLTHASGHSILVNAKAMELAGISSATTIGEEGEIYHFPNGEPTGLFAEGAMGLVRAHIPPPTEEESKAALQAAIDRCLREGVTSFQDAGARQEEINRFISYQDAGDLPVRLSVMLSGSDSALLENWYEKGPLIGDGLSVRGIKLYADGALGSRGAWLLQPYSDRPGHYGNPVTPIEKIEGIAAKGLASGFQVCTHAIGDRANQEVLDAYQRVFEATEEPVGDVRFRIEHAQHLNPDDIPRFAELGVIASMQGIHLSSDRPWAIDRLGRLRIIQGAYMWKALKESGAVVINGTDVPVEPLDPMANYYALVTRKTLLGQPEGGYEADQKLDRIAALRAYTTDGAYGSFREGITGSLVSGKRADFLVLSNDLIQCPEEEIMDTRVLQTWIDGKLEYSTTE